jgi:type IV secretion system protein VirB10
MLPIVNRAGRLAFACAALIGLVPVAAIAQESVGPQTAAPPPVPPAKHAEHAPSGQKIIVPAGTRLAVTLENGISTNSAKPGDSLYFHTSFPITQNNHVVIPVGSYVRGTLLESKRPGRVKGKGEFRLRLESLIFPNGYTVDLLAAPRSADTGGKETTDSEGKVTGPGGKGKDVGTIATTTATGAGIGAIADGGKGAGIGAGVGGVVGLAAILLTRGPDAQIPRGSTLDIVLEKDLSLDADHLGFDDTGRPTHITRSVSRSDSEQK